jgi:serine/threonine protein kinase
VIAGRYRIETLIGMGGMGAVYRASDTFDIQQVALKVLSSAKFIADMDTAVERFRREARYAHQLQHKNIVPVLNFGQDGNLLYLVMPLVTGGTLKELLKAEHPLPIPQAQRYLNDLADAIDAIHHHPQQIIHRDIKPSNLLIHQDDGRLVITDFGIARATQQEKALTQRGWRLGTEHYIAPEQEHGKAEPASDIYAMGVIGYQMLTGLLPFQAVVRSHAAELPPPSALNPALPSAIDPVILRAINIDPIKRFGTAREFADALNASLAQERDTDYDFWTAPTISTTAGLGLAPTPDANVIVRAIIPENPCGSCGRENRSTSHFCRHCGYSLTETSPLVTDVCQVGYVGAGPAPTTAGQQAHYDEDILLIVQGLCNTLQPPPRPFSLFAVADGREQVSPLQVRATAGHQALVTGLSPARLAIETITDVLLPLLSTSTSTHSLIGTPSGSALAPIPTSASYKGRLQPTKQVDVERTEQWLLNAVRQANQVIYHCNADFDTTMASTLASVILHKRYLYVACVGHSRVYCYNGKMGLQQIGGAVTQDQAINNHYLGERHQVAVELCKREIDVDDLILLCTDELWRMLNNEQIQKILALGGDTQMLAYTLVEAANTASGADNSSAIVVRVQ